MQSVDIDSTLNDSCKRVKPLSNKQFTNNNTALENCVMYFIILLLETKVNK